MTVLCSQVPHLSGIEASKASLKNRGVLASIRLFGAGLHDRARALAGLPAAYLKVAGTPGSNSFMELSEGDLQQYFAKHPSKYAVSHIAVPLHAPWHQCNLCKHKHCCMAPSAFRNSHS